MCWVQSVRANCRTSLMAAKRRANRRAARKEKSGERTTVGLIRSRKCTSKLTRGSGARPFPVGVRGRSESIFEHEERKLHQCRGTQIVVSNARIAGNPPATQEGACQWIETRSCDLSTINATARMQAIRREGLPPDLPTQRGERAGRLPPSMPARATMPH
jgi:hypothetical protein